MKFGLTVTHLLMDKIISYCLESGSLETGGILIGYYNQTHDNAIITDVTSAPIDSRRQRASFVRGVSGLQNLIDRIWARKKYYYIGEWHFHPFCSPDASMTDLQQLQKHSASESLNCPEPVMLIVGGDPRNAWRARAYVSPRHRPYQEMLLVDTKDKEKPWINQD